MVYNWSDIVYWDRLPFQCISGAGMHNFRSYDCRTGVRGEANMINKRFNDFFLPQESVYLIVFVNFEYCNFKFIRLKTEKDELNLMPYTKYVIPCIIRKRWETSCDIRYTLQMRFLKVLLPYHQRCCHSSRIDSVCDCYVCWTYFVRL